MHYFVIDSATQPGMSLQTPLHKGYCTVETQVRTHLLLQLQGGDISVLKAGQLRIVELVIFTV